MEDERDEDREERNGQTVDDEQQTQSGKGQNDKGRKRESAIETIVT